jgi:hypothetical protein
MKMPNILWLCFVLLVLSLAELVFIVTTIVLSFAHLWVCAGACAAAVIAVGFVESQMVREFWDVEDAT